MGLATAAGTKSQSPLILLLGLLWASESALGKAALERGAGTFDFPLVLNAGTVVAAGCLMVRPATRQDFLKWSWAKFSAILGVALTLVFVPYLVIFLALRQITPAEASLVTSLTPVFSIAIAVAVYRSHLSPKAVLALLLGIAGVCFLVVPDLGQGAGQANAVWYLIMLTVPTSYAISGFLLQKCAELEVSYPQLLLVTNLISGLMFLVLNRGFSVAFDGGAWPLYPVGIVFNISAIALMLHVSARVTPFSLSFANHATLLFAFVLSVLFFSQQLSIGVLVAAALIVSSSVIAQERSELLKT